ncbi:MAG: NAD-dependent epimerase/dehydratase family protein [Spirochaetales bacterium]
MHVLLTGAAGFVGARTAARLLEDGYTLTAVDNFNDYYDPRLKEHRVEQLSRHRGCTFLRGDIEDYSTVESLFESKRPEAVINPAARAGVRASIEDPFVYLRTNATGTLNLLEAMRRYDVGKLVLASTSSLYAGSDMPFVESLPVNTPISPYAASKKAAEALAYSYHSLYDIDVSVLRYFTVFGPAGRPDMMPFRFIKWISEGTPLTLYGDGSASRDFTYVDDIAEGTVRALTPLGYEVINLGGGRNPITVSDIIEKMEKLIGRRARIDYRDPVAADMKSTWADISKAARLLDWSPSVDVDEGLARTVEWHKEHAGLVADMRVD